MAIPARRRPSRTGLAGKCSWNSQVPASTKYTLLATLDTGTRMDARQACNAAWYSSRAAAEQAASRYRYGDVRMPNAMPATVWPPVRTPARPLVASEATP
jgi:hypothetical protein